MGDGIVKHAVAFVLPILMILGLGGCSAVKGFPDRSVDISKETTALAPYLQPSAITAFDSDNPADRMNLTRKAWRNEVLEARIRVDDLNFGAFEQSLYEQGVGFGIGTDWLILALTGAGAVASGGSANLLSAAAAGVTGARSSFDKEALYQKTLPVLMAQMVAKRKEILVRVRTGEDQDESAYPLTRGLSDLEGYYYAGTIPGALNDIATNTGAQSRQADIDLKSLQVVGPVEASLQARRENAAAFIKDVFAKKPEDIVTLGRAMGIANVDTAKPDEVLKEALLSIGAAQTPNQFELIAQKMKILYGKDF